LLGLSGAWVEPIKRLSIFDADEFEIFVEQWASEYLLHKYYQVQKRGGSGDKGRDVVAWIDSPDVSPRKWDSYQCKHYKNPLMPSDFWLELGKLCYYTFIGDFTTPETYYVVASLGVGTTLQDYIDDPEQLRTRLIENWQKYCEDHITASARIALEGDFETYVNQFDFSIIQSLSPNTLIDQHSHTKYHAYVFGTKLEPRPSVPSPPSNVAPFETRYIQNIYDAFADHLKVEVRDRDGFANAEHLVHAFDHARESFYSAEALKEFARDNLPDNSYFIDILKQFFDGLQVVLYEPHVDGFSRMLAAHKLSTTLQIDSNALRDVIRSNDRVGMCHQLSNEGKIKWIKP
jgi:hypothetical protein